MEFIICKLEPKDALHLGTKEGVQEVSDEYIHSDTLFSAMCNALRLLYGKRELEKMLSLFDQGNEPFLISSAFPYTNETLLFPLPKHIDWAKKTKEPIPFKKVKFIDFEIFQKTINDESISEYLSEENLIQEKSVLLAHERGDKIWQSYEVPRVALDRKTGASNIYHFTEIRYSRGCGLFFLIELIAPDYEKKLKACINLLSHEGIGGDRTSGKGLFKKPCFKEGFIIKVPQESKCFVTLSLYFPKRDEIKSVEEGHYELVKRGGWIYSVNSRTLRRKSVRMLEEGSVFPDFNNKGELVDVTPQILKDHRVYRYGYTFKIPIKVRK